MKNMKNIILVLMLALTSATYGQMTIDTFDAGLGKVYVDKDSRLVKFDGAKEIPQGTYYMIERKTLVRMKNQLVVMTNSMCFSQTNEFYDEHIWGKEGLREITKLVYLYNGYSGDNSYKIIGVIFQVHYGNQVSENSEPVAFKD